jgi:diaminopimelate decarboxylase
MESLIKKIFNNNINNLKNIDTPYYLYDLNLLEDTVNNAIESAKRYNYILHYAFKANWNEPILEIIRNKGIGADCVSGFEIEHAIKNKFNPQDIVFAGVRKTDKEITLALKNDIFSFNCESIQEIQIINNIAEKLGKTANIALRINPNVNAKTHHYITTGLEENKFGINIWELKDTIEIIRNSKNIELKGLHFHIGSQITDWLVYKNLCTRINEINVFFAENNFNLEYLNLGGGLGVNYYEPDNELIIDFNSFFSLINNFLNPFPFQKIHFEPGRSLVAQCGSLISKVIYLKKGKQTNFLIVDAGMTELMRPALYQAYHKIENLTSLEKEIETYDVVGPICESSDCFGRRINLPISKRDDIIAIRTTGAYGEAMSSRYNMRPLPNSIYLK